MNKPLGKFEHCICNPFALMADIMCPIHGDLEAINRAMTEATEDETPQPDTAAQPAATGKGYEPSNWGPPGFAKNRNRRPGGRAR